MDLQYACPTFLVEMGYHSILCKARSVASANATAKGMFNTTVRMIPMQLNQFSHIKEIDFDNRYININMSGTVINDLATHLITPEYLEIKRLARLRSEFLWALEVRLHEGIWRLHDYYEPKLEAFLLSELTKCNPATNEYTDALHEYAAISEVDVATIYQELDMKTRTAGLIRLRNKALYDKYVRIMNTANTRDEMLIILHNALTDAYSKHRL
jgi:hypothetical protein